MNGFIALINGTPVSTFAHSLPWEAKIGSRSSATEKKPLTRTLNIGLNFRFPAFRIVRYKFLWFISHQVWYFVIEAWLRLFLWN
jgi:hypothetical protein